MTPRDPRPATAAEFDRQARALYRQSLEQVPAGVHARLRQARGAALAGPRHRSPPWLPATAVLAVVALAGLQPAPERAPEAPLVLAAPVDADVPTPLALSDPELALILDSLDHNPDFYLWLASSDDAVPER
ncbi:hypothetical protein [Novilysobacter defluvii]|uniref:hypothetical protein n=1 Tax=Novilysobacter defluvii TaxID=391738 RepID=UPI000420E6DA|nr:hypothetical protein [Lysobacter defluvii]